MAPGDVSKKQKLEKQKVAQRAGYLDAPQIFGPKSFDNNDRGCTEATSFEGATWYLWMYRRLQDFFHEFEGRPFLYIEKDITFVDSKSVAWKKQAAMHVYACKTEPTKAIMEQMMRKLRYTVKHGKNGFDQVNALKKEDMKYWDPSWFDEGEEEDTEVNTASQPASPPSSSRTALTPTGRSPPTQTVPHTALASSQVSSPSALPRQAPPTESTPPAQCSPVLVSRPATQSGHLSPSSSQNKDGSESDPKDWRNDAIEEFDIDDNEEIRPGWVRALKFRRPEVHQQQREEPSPHEEEYPRQPQVQDTHRPEQAETVQQYDETMEKEHERVDEEARRVDEEDRRVEEARRVENARRVERARRNREGQAAHDKVREQIRREIKAQVARDKEREQIRCEIKEQVAREKEEKAEMYRSVMAGWKKSRDSFQKKFEEKFGDLNIKRESE